MQTTIQANDITENSYIERNRRWFLPLVATFIVVAVPAVLEMFKDIDPSHAANADEIIPKKLVAGIALGGAVLAGLGAQITATTSALIFRRLLAVASAVAVLTYALPMLFGR